MIQRHDQVRSNLLQRGCHEGDYPLEDLHSTPATHLMRYCEHVLVAHRRLPLEQQTLLELHDMQEMEIAELAEVFGASAVTIRTRLHRARKQLREFLDSNRAVARFEDERVDA